MVKLGIVLNRAAQVVVLGPVAMMGQKAGYQICLEWDSEQDRGLGRRRMGRFQDWKPCSVSTLMEKQWRLYITPLRMSLKWRQQEASDSLLNCGTGI